MLREEVQKLFETEKVRILEDLKVQRSELPIAILLGGQPAAGKSSLTEAAKANHPGKNFLVINGDNYREFHPNHYKLIKSDIANYSKETQIFSNVFTEGFINEAIRNKYNVIIEGTMRNPETPLRTAGQLREAGFRVEVYAIAAPSAVTEVEIFNRYQEELEKKGAGRLSELEVHNEAVKGLPVSLDTIYSQKAVDKISIYTFRSREKVIDMVNTEGNRDRTLKPSFYVEESVKKQLSDKSFLMEIKAKGYATLEKISPNLKGILSDSINKLSHHEE